VAVKYGILEFSSSNNLEDIYLRILQKSSLSHTVEEQEDTSS
jgi:hypothetical protein